MDTSVPLKEKTPFLKITQRAAQKIKEILATRASPALGIRIGIKSRGCSGLSYVLEYAEEYQSLDEVIESQGVKVFIDPKAVMFLIGTEMIYEENDLQSGFIFKNPNEKGRCGCGESFHV